MGEPLGEGEAPAVVVVVVVAGDIADVAGVVPAMGEIPGAVEAGATGFVPVMVAPGAGGTAGFVAGGTAGLTAAGLVAVVGGAPGGRLVGGAVGGGGWPNEVSARVTEQRLAISSVFIGLVGKVFPGTNSDELFILLNEISASRAKLSRMSFDVLVPGGATILVRIIRPCGM